MILQHLHYLHSNLVHYFVEGKQSTMALKKKNNTMEVEVPIYYT